jgi:FixH
MGEITGPRVFAFTASAFAVIIGVNVFMAYQAISTFPGLEVKSSYVASQSFDAERAAQNALGLTLTQSYDPALGQISLRLCKWAMCRFWWAAARLRVMILSPFWPIKAGSIWAMRRFSPANGCCMCRAMRRMARCFASALIFG